MRDGAGRRSLTCPSDPGLTSIKWSFTAAAGLACRTIRRRVGVPRPSGEGDFQFEISTKPSFVRTNVVQF